MIDRGRRCCIRAWNVLWRSSTGPQRKQCAHEQQTNKGEPNGSGHRNHSAVLIPPKEEPGFRPKKGFRRLLADALGAAHQRANIAECIPKISRWRVWQRRGVGPVKCDDRTSFSHGRGHRLRQGAGGDQAVSLFPFSALLLLRHGSRLKRHRITSGRLGATRYRRCAALHNQSSG